MHAVNLEFHTQFGHSITLESFVLLVVKINTGQGGALVGTGDGKGVSSITEGGSKIPVVGVMHPNRKVQRHRIAKGNASDFYRVHHRNQSNPSGAASYPFRYHSLVDPMATSVNEGRITTTSTVRVQSFPGSGSSSPMSASGSDC